MAERMNNNQQAVFQIVTEAIECSPVTAHFFLEGAGGTGKTYLYRAPGSYYHLRLHKDQDDNEIQKLVVCVA
jgi:chromosomal replication initiation ATPase DnaA